MDKLIPYREENDCILFESKRRMLNQGKAKHKRNSLGCWIDENLLNYNQEFCSKHFHEWSTELIWQSLQRIYWLKIWSNSINF